MSAGAIVGFAATNAAMHALKATGAVLRVTPEEFLTVVARESAPLVVIAIGGLFARSYKYLISHKGLVFCTKSGTQLNLPADTQLIKVDRLWIPR